MKSARAFIFVPLFFIQTLACATESNFSGTWVIDLRSTEEQKANVECGTAEFKLTKNAENISGEHTFATVGCGRLNEGGPKTVSGIIVGNTAVLVVTSGRNGAMVLGKATLQGDMLYWQTLQELQPGEPAEDSPLILSNGVLTRVNNQ
jgi:hypothetical protein